MLSIINYLAIGLLFFLAYSAIRSSITHRGVTSLLISIIIMAGGITIQPENQTDGSILIIAGLLLLIITVAERRKTENEE